MIHLIIVALNVIFSVHQARAQEFSATQQDVIELHKIEERLLPFLDAFISEREAHLKELEGVLSKTAASRATSGQDIGEYLGNPLNQFHIVKRFVDDWGKLADYLHSDTSTDGKFVLSALFSKLSRQLSKISEGDPKTFEEYSVLSPPRIARLKNRAASNLSQVLQFTYISQSSLSHTFRFSCSEKCIATFSIYIIL